MLSQHGMDMLHTYVYTPTWYTPSVRGVDFGDSREVGTASRPLFCFGLSTVHYIDKDSDISFSIFQYDATRSATNRIPSRETLPIEPKLPSLYKQKYEKITRTTQEWVVRVICQHYKWWYLLEKHTLHCVPAK